MVVGGRCRPIGRCPKQIYHWYAATEPTLSQLNKMIEFYQFESKEVNNINRYLVKSYLMSVVQCTWPQAWIRTRWDSSHQLDFQLGCPCESKKTSILCKYSVIRTFLGMSIICRLRKWDTSWHFVLIGISSFIHKWWCFHGNKKALPNIICHSPDSKSIRNGHCSTVTITRFAAIHMRCEVQQWAH